MLSGIRRFTDSNYGRGEIDKVDRITGPSMRSSTQKWHSTYVSSNPSLGAVFSYGWMVGSSEHANRFVSSLVLFLSTPSHCRSSK
jgi:hypothetical protein